MLQPALDADVIQRLLNIPQHGHALMAKGAFMDIKRRTDASEYGGAPLLGVKGVCIICHGRSNANAMKNAIRIAAEFSRENMNDRIEDELQGVVV